jgi:hypothetical protein
VIYIIIDGILFTIQPVKGLNMGKLRDISGWIIATALTVVLGALAAGCGKRVQEADGEQTDFEFEIAADSNSVMITKYVGEKLDVCIPPKLQGLPVTRIGIEAFRKKEIVSVTIPSSVTAIGHLAFADNQLTSVDIPNSVTTIGYQAFAQNQLTSVTIPSSVTTLYPSAFLENHLTEFSVAEGNPVYTAKEFFLLSKNEKVLIMYYGNVEDVVIPSSVTVIESRAFANRRLISVVIPSSVIEIGDYAFADNQLTGVAIPNYMTKIGSKAFARNQATFTLAIAQTGEYDDVKDFEFRLVDDGKEIAGYTGNRQTVRIPSRLYGWPVTKIGYGAFANNQLTVVAIPEGVIGIEKMAFSNNQLTAVTIPSSVTWIGANAFSGNQLTSVIIPNRVSTIDEFAFSQNQLASVTIPSSVTTIGRGAFSHNPLTAFSVASDNAAYITQDRFLLSKDGKDLLMYYGNEQNVTIPNNVTRIICYAFDSKRLASVSIPNSVTWIGEGAFLNNRLTSVTIPSSVTKIEQLAFTDNRLTDITIGADVELFVDGKYGSSFDDPFGSFYNDADNGRVAGVYILRNAEWSRRE